jgi:hypothetical protein
VNDLPPGPFQVTSSTFPYYGYAASPVHRFYQMWQQSDCLAEDGTLSNPSGCLADLFAWVEVTVGAGTNGLKQPANFSGCGTLDPRHRRTQLKRELCHCSVNRFNCHPIKTQRQSCSAGQEAVFVVKSVQDGVHHTSAWLVSDVSDVANARGN